MRKQAGKPGTIRGRSPGGDSYCDREDLERYGPTLIVDHKGRAGERVLVWSQ